MAKKKIKETLSKREKEFLADAREVMKEDLEDNYNSLLEYYDGTTLNYEYRNIESLNQFKNDLDREINKIFCITEFTEVSVFTTYTNLLQVATKLNEVFVLEKDRLINKLNESVNKMIEEDLENIIRNTKDSCTPRSLAIFKEDLIKKKYKIKDKAFSIAIKEIDKLLQVALEQGTETETYAMESVQLINDHLKSIKYSNNMLEIKIEKTGNIREATICGYTLDTYTFGCFITRNIESDIDKEGLQEQSNEVKKIVGDYTLIQSNNVKLADGRVLKWNGNDFNVDASTITDKSYSYKELNSLAISKGYVLNRSNGDHAIYVKQGKDNVVIPQKVLGKGLQLKILKDLKII